MLHVFDVQSFVYRVFVCTFVFSVCVLFGIKPAVMEIQNSEKRTCHISSDLQQHEIKKMAHTMPNQEYSLKWSNHTENILMSLETLLQSENLVDVTLICGKTSLRAHRVILSVCSPYFQKIFSETPCNHPVVVLHDFRGADVQDLLTFMYRGEVSVVQSRLESILKAAESLQIRGLGDHNKNSPKPPEPVHAVIYEGDENGCGNRYIHQRCSLGTKNSEESPEDGDGTTPVRLDSISPSSSSNYELTTKQTKRSYMEVPTSRHKSRSECPSPVYRRKQARPRRCSKDNSNVQDLSTGSPRSPQPQEDVAENLCTKKTEERYANIKREFKTSSPDLPKSPEMDMRDFRTSPLSLLQPHLSMNHEMDNHPHIPFPPMPSVSALTMTAPQGKFFGLDAQPLGLFPPGLENCRNNFFELDHRAQEHQNVKKKSKSKAKRRKKTAFDKLGRPKGQHSAPRGGPPRSWTNSELTEALQHVWNKKMTTSQASRVFGIPYNSLLMYVRGKYGKSLKLEQLRKDCIGSPNPTAELISMNTTNNNNTVVKNEREPEPVQPNTRPPSAENLPQPTHPNYLAHLIPPYYAAEFHNFSLPMMHQFLPHGDRSREHFSNQAPPSQSQSQHKSEVDHSNSEALDEDAERFRSPSIDERRDVTQQNGQN